MKRNRSPGPDGFPADFYQDFWDMVKWDLKALVEGFARGKLILPGLTMALLPWSPKPMMPNKSKISGLYAC